jgi:hypothetical protein
LKSYISEFDTKKLRNKYNFEPNTISCEFFPKENYSVNELNKILVKKKTANLNGKTGVGLV